jgi:hypothetical protein
MLAEPHHGPLPMLLLDLLERHVEHPFPFHVPYLPVRERRDARVRV